MIVRCKVGTFLITFCLLLKIALFLWILSSLNWFLTWILSALVLVSLSRTFFNSCLCPSYEAGFEAELLAIEIPVVDEIAWLPLECFVSFKDEIVLS